MNNYIGIDISLNSTAIYIESNKGKRILSFTNKKDNNIYIKELSQCGVIFSHIYRDSSSEYSKNEIIKISHFDDISDSIVSDILSNCDINEVTHCNVEGYSFSKNTSSILDIVAMSTLIKSKLLKRISNINMDVISPSSLKLEACKLVYPPIDIGIKKPKLKYVNSDGISGGSFKKPQMYKALLDGNIDVPIFNMLNNYRHLIDRDKIPNPIEDIIDAIFACKIKIKEIEVNI